MTLTWTLFGCLHLQPNPNVQPKLCDSVKGLALPGRSGHTPLDHGNSCLRHARFWRRARSRKAKCGAQGSSLPSLSKFYSTSTHARTLARGRSSQRTQQTDPFFPVSATCTHALERSALSSALWLWLVAGAVSQGPLVGKETKNLQTCA